MQYQPPVPPAPSGGPSLSSRIRTAAYFVGTGLFLISPFSIATAFFLYIFLMLAVAVYAAYIALKEFIRDEVLQGTAFAWEPAGADAGAVAIPGALNDTEDLPVFLRDSQVLQTLFLGPPLFVYVSSRGIVTAALHVMRWAFWQTVYAVPTVARGVRWAGVATYHLAQDVGGVIRTTWTFVKRPVMEIATTIGVIAKSCANACWAVAQAFRQLCEDALLLAWKAAISARNAAAALARPLKLFASALYRLGTPPIQALAHGMHVAANFGLSVLKPVVAHITDGVIRCASNIGPALSSLFAAAARLGEKSIAIFNAHLIPPLKRLAVFSLSCIKAVRSLAASVLNACALASQRVITGIIHPFVVVLQRSVATAHALLARLGIYSFIVALPDRLVYTLDAVCHNFEMGVSFAARLTWRLTMRVHALATPVFYALLTALTPIWAAAVSVFAWCYGVAESYAQAGANAARAMLAVVGAMYLWALTEVERAAHRAVKYGDAVGQHIARLGASASSSPVVISAKID
ncbi:hypothetical protein HDU86_006852 [Geranomyces michiganensis]|nr:hypothetical protein HDU86_006852 [Geranomyces michiganensis]